ncbi:MAG TPA: c-type cytochrome [Candidatus Tectomicrobia bacterium]|nr:c-type cytochrome [Candidatus Tectomicrobia bacterium]
MLCEFITRTARVVLVLSVVGSGLDSGGLMRWASALEQAKEAPDVLRRGRQVYEANCIMCHGSHGDGQGVAAHMFRVPPRDFRQGLFKFRSTPSGALPTDSDLLQTVTHGVRWTGMVGRPDLSEADRRAVVHYLKTFSPRFAAEPPALSVAVPRPPPPSQALLEQGRRLYDEAGCAQCHGEGARGDGPAATGLKDDWGWPTRPSDLTWRPLKRGSSVEGLYLSLVTGLAGTPMPSYGEALASQDIWALVAYLESLVPTARRLSPARVLGDEPRGWMAVRMGRMRGHGPMGPGMPHRMP